MSQPREGRLERVEDGPCLLGQLVVNLFEPPLSDSGFASLLTPLGADPLPEFFLGRPLAGSVRYSAHGGLLVRDAAHGQYLPSQQGGLPSENPKKRQKSSLETLTKR